MPPGKSVLGKIERKKKTVYFEHLSAHPHLPMQTLPVGTSAQGASACTQKHTVRLSKPGATDLRLSFAASSHCKQTHQTPSTSFCSQSWQSDALLGSKLSQNKPNLESTRVGVEDERVGNESWNVTFCSSRLAGPRRVQWGTVGALVNLSLGTDGRCGPLDLLMSGLCQVV